MVRWLRALFGARRLDRELDAEVGFHIEMETEKYVRQGMDPQAARRRAVGNFGSLARHKEDAREARGVLWIEDLSKDLRFGVRTLARSPGFTIVAVLTLALGIGANTAIFSVINGVLLKPLPYENGERLLLVRQSAPTVGQDDVGVSIRELYDYREQLESFEGLVEVHLMNFDLLRRGEPDRVATGVVSPNFFDVLGLRPIYGRTFVESDDHEGAEAVLVLGHSYWQTRFGGDPSVVGQVLEMNDRPHTVVGVLPAVPHYPNEVDVYMPTSACPFRAAAERLVEEDRRAFPILQVFGLLKPGASAGAAAVEVTTVGQRFRQDFPHVYRAGSGFQARAAGVLQELTTDARPMLYILLGTTVLVLLIACANVANLTLARTLRRHRELAMRAALGAGRWRLVRQLLTESTLIAVAGGVLGLAFAWATLDLLAAFVGRFTQRTGEIAIDPWVLAFTLGVSLVTGLLFGTLPALASRADLVTALKQGNKGGRDTDARPQVQNALIVAQVAVSVVLLVGAGLLLVSLFRLQDVDPGYRADRVITAEIFGNFSKYPDARSLRRLYQDVLQRVDAAPGVVSAAVTNAVPLAGLQPGQTKLRIEGQTHEDPDLAPAVDVRVASPRYFETLGVPVVAGRVFTDHDREDSVPVAVINQAATRFWNGRDPIGWRVSPDDGETWHTIVGQVGDVKQFGLDREAVAQLYVPLAQAQAGLAGRLLLRTSGDPMGLARLIRENVHAVDPDMPIENVRTLDELREGYLATPRLTATLLTVFATLALLVTLTGITGVIATSVSQRTQEFGVRMALGASPDRVLRMVIVQGLGLVALGLAIGIGGALVLSRVLQSYLFETAPTDPLAFAVVAFAFTGAGLAACLGPAWRATTVDPMLALRAE